MTKNFKTKPAMMEKYGDIPDTEPGQNVKSTEVHRNILQTGQYSNKRREAHIKATLVTDIGSFSVLVGVCERATEGNDIYREMIKSGVIKLGDKQTRTNHSSDLETSGNERTLPSGLHPTGRCRAGGTVSATVGGMFCGFAITKSLQLYQDNEEHIVGGEWPVISHAPWNGCNLADFVMPFFLFIVGMAIPLSLKRIPNRLLAVRRVMIRTLKLLFWGILLQGGYSHAPDKLSYGVDMKHIRWCGILQRIALSYLVVSLFEILTKNENVEADSPSGLLILKLYCWQWLLGACILTIYLVVMYATYVPDWEFTVRDVDSQDYGKVFTVICGSRGRLDPPCNAVGYMDRQILGINHLYKRPAWKRSKACTYDSPYDGTLRKDAPTWCLAPFEPEGILSSISAILSTIIGVHFGHVLLHMKFHIDRLKHWIGMGVALLILGLVLHFSHAIPLNKQLYSFSYVCVTAGAAALVFSAFYILVDIVGLRNCFLPLEWIGMNAMLVYVMAAAGIFAGFVNGWYYDTPNNTLVYWIQKHVFVQVWHSRRVGVLLYVIFAEIFFWAIVAGILHRLGIYWKL